MKKIFILVLLVSSVIFFSCEDENNNENNNFDTEIVGPDQILENINITNLNSTVFPWAFDGFEDGRPCTYAEITNGRIKRWDFENQGLIPIKLGGFTLGEQALDLIESQLGLTLFDRNSIANTSNDAITKGIIFSEGTASGPNPARDCGHVSAGVGTFAYPTQLLDDIFTIEFNYDVNGNIEGYDNPILDQAYDEDGEVYGNILEGTRLIFNADDNDVVGMLAEADELLYDFNGNAICNTLGGESLFDSEGIVIGAKVLRPLENGENGPGIYILGPQGFQYIYVYKFNYSNVYYDTACRINTVLYVHIGSMACESEITLDLVVHEIGHALGLGPHFQGFGFGPAIDGNFWNVLNTLYNNDIGKNQSAIEIQQIVF